MLFPSYLGPTLPTSKSVEYIALGLLGPTSGLPCQPANHWISWLRAYSSLPRAYLANQQIIGFHCFGTTWAYLGPTLPEQSLLCNLCYADFAMQALLLCYAIFAMQSLLVQSLLCNLWYAIFAIAIFAMQSLLCSLCYASFAMAILAGLHRAYLCQPDYSFEKTWVSNLILSKTIKNPFFATLCLGNYFD